MVSDIKTYREETVIKLSLRIASTTSVRPQLHFTKGCVSGISILRPQGQMRIRTDLALMWYSPTIRPQATSTSSRPCTLDRASSVICAQLPRKTTVTRPCMLLPVRS